MDSPQATTNIITRLNSRTPGPNLIFLSSFFFCFFFWLFFFTHVPVFFFLPLLLLLLLRPFFFDHRRPSTRSAPPPLPPPPLPLSKPPTTHRPPPTAHRPEAPRRPGLFQFACISMQMSDSLQKNKRKKLRKKWKRKEIGFWNSKKKNIAISQWQLGDVSEFGGVGLSAF